MQRDIYFTNVSLAFFIISLALMSVGWLHKREHPGEKGLYNPASGFRINGAGRAIAYISDGVT